MKTDYNKKSVSTVNCSTELRDILKLYSENNGYKFISVINAALYEYIKKKGLTNDESI